MEEKKLNQSRWFVAGLLIILFIAGGFVVLLNNNNVTRGSSVPSTDPEKGIQMWIDAVNEKNIDRLYNLTPDEIKQQRTLTQFKEDNINNTLLKPGYKFLNWNVMDKKQNRTYAQILASLTLLKPADQGSPDQEIPVIYKFALYYQHDEWKSWTLG